MRRASPHTGPVKVASERRAEILDAAAELFASGGYSGTSLKDVADACGILVVVVGLFNLGAYT
jgi:AcrR family transcriptional regulator